jgi:lipoyl(octanoyl) transferase
LRWSYLGRVDYDAARALQNRLAVARAVGACDDVLLLLEHPPVLTVGRHAPAPAPARWPLVRTDRGGSITYHGPGQLVGYPVVALRAAGRGVRTFVAALEGAMCDVACAVGVAAHPRAGLPGVWTGSPLGERKLGAIGLAVRRGVTLHGCALNVDERAERGFDGVRPCGLAGVRATSLAGEGATGAPTPASVAPLFAQHLARRLGLVPHACRDRDELFAGEPRDRGDAAEPTGREPLTTSEHGPRPAP